MERRLAECTRYYYVCTHSEVMRYRDRALERYLLTTIADAPTTTTITTTHRTHSYYYYVCTHYYYYTIL